MKARTVAVVALLAVALAATASASDRPLRPIAAGVLSDGDLVLLDRHHGLFRLQPESRRLTALRMDLGRWDPIDMTVVQDRGGDRIYVTLRWAVHSTMVLAAVVEFDASGRRLGMWRVNMPQVAGVAVDPRRREAYLTSTFEPEVYTLDLARTSATPTRLMRLFGARGLGPLALDRERQLLYAADPSTGSLLRIEIGEREMSVVARGLGVVSALALSADGRRLYVLDSSRGRIWTLDDPAAAHPLEPRELARLESARDSLALAVGAGGAVWVGDAGTSILTKLRDGKPDRAFRLIRP